MIAQEYVSTVNEEFKAVIVINFVFDMPSTNIICFLKHPVCKRKAFNLKMKTHSEEKNGRKRCEAHTRWFFSLVPP